MDGQFTRTENDSIQVHKQSIQYSQLTMFVNGTVTELISAMKSIIWQCLY